MSKEKKIPHYSIADLALGKLPPDEALKLLEAIESDPDASKELDVQTELINLVSAEGKEIFEPARSTRPSFVQKRWLDRLTLLGFSRWPSVALGAAAIVALLWIGLSLGSSLTRPPYDEMAQIERTDQEFRTRGVTYDELSVIPALCSEERFDDVIRLCERFIRAYPASDLVGFAHYSAGFSYLASARRSTLGFFPSYEGGRVEKALKHFAYVAGDTAHSPLAEDAMWLEAKGFLMIENPVAAQTALSRLVAMNGRRREEAQDLLRRINIRGVRL